MPYRSTIAVALGLLILAGAAPLLQAEDWQPVSADELAMTSEPSAPGAPAVYLYRQVDRDDSSHEERNYERIKILTEAGRDRANIELRYIKNSQAIAFIKARLIRPDGEPFVTYEEVGLRAEAAERRAEKERRRADRLQAELEKLRKRPPRK